MQIDADRLIIVAEFDYLSCMGRFKEVQHGDKETVFARSIVFAYGMCPIENKCEFCTIIRLRIKRVSE